MEFGQTVQTQNSHFRAEAEKTRNVRGILPLKCLDLGVFKPLLQHSKINISVKWLAKIIVNSRFFPKITIIGIKILFFL